MAKNIIEILLIKLGERMIGLDCREVVKVISRIKSGKDKDIVKSFKNNGRLFDISEKLKINIKSNFSSYISVEMGNGKDLLIAVPEISNIINTDISKILVVPELIRKFQKPFFVWGFLENDERLISLITFSFLNIGDKYER
jgi:hypothetical protein